MENKKALIALALVALVGVAGATFAYFTSTAKLTNTFTTGTYATSVTEEFVSPDNWAPGTTTTKKVNVTNNGSVKVAVRATFTEKWTAKDRGNLPLARSMNDGTTERIAQFTIGSDWEKATDGYYYYNGTLSTGETSSDFISSVTFNPNFELMPYQDIMCTTKKEDGKTTTSCTSRETGYAGATYSLDITIETIQADQAWTYTTPSLITFSVEGTSFQALEGMTWTEFLVSEYNTSDLFYIDNWNFNYVGGFQPADSQNNVQWPDDVIKANEAYHTEYVGMEL